MEEGNQYKKGLWTLEEDKVLMDYVKVNGKGQWNRIAKKTGLRRCGKSCRLRWMNYLSPGVKRGDFTAEEEDLIIRLHKLLGNSVLKFSGTDIREYGLLRWSLIASIITNSREVQKESKPPMNSISAPSCGSSSGAAKPQENEGNLLQGLEAPDWNDEQLIEEGCFNPFWAINDDLELSNNNLVEFLNGCSLDLGWHGL